MNTLIIPERSSTALLFNGSTMEYKEVTHSSTNIDWMWVAPEDCEVRYKQNGNTVIRNAEKGDIIIKFYNKSVEGLVMVVVIKNKDWKTNMALVEAKENYEKEKFLALHKSECNICCDN